MCLLSKVKTCLQKIQRRRATIANLRLSKEIC
jgi:hypothetical protein